MENGEVLEESKEDWRIVWASLSWLLLVGVAGGAVAFRRLRPLRPAEPTEGRPPGDRDQP